MDAPASISAISADAVGGGPTTTIEARQRRPVLNLGELWQYRELAYFLVWRDIKVRYKQTVIGAAWAIVQPVCTMIVFSLIFGRFAGIPSEGVPYPVFVYAGLLPWLFFANAVSQSSQSLVTQARLITKIYFPRLYVPAASIGVGVVDFGISFLVYLAILTWYAHAPSPAIVLLPALLLLTAVTAFGVGVFLASMNVIYRDFRMVVPFLVQTWMYVSPVVYPATIVPEGYRWILYLNPMTGIIGGFRSVLLNQPLDWVGLVSAMGIAVFILCIGLWNFRRMERRFADIA